MNKKTIQNLHEKLVEITAALKLEQSSNESLKNKLLIIEQNRHAIQSSRGFAAERIPFHISPNNSSIKLSQDDDDTSSSGQVDLLTEELTLSKSVNRNLKSKLLETIERTSLMLNAIQNYEQKMKDQMQTLVDVVDKKFSNLKLSIARVTHGYNQLVTKFAVRSVVK